MVLIGVIGVGFIDASILFSLSFLKFIYYQFNGVLGRNRNKFVC
jgi:hypothetical protein